MKLNTLIAFLVVIYISITAGVMVERHRESDRYNRLLTKWNRFVSTANAKQMFGTGEWYCGNMVVSCNKDGYLNMDGNIPTKQ